MLRLRSLGESDLMLDVFTSAMGPHDRPGQRRQALQSNVFSGFCLDAHLLEMNLEPTKSPDLWRLGLGPGAGLPPGFAPGLPPPAGRWADSWNFCCRATPVQAPQEGVLELALDYPVAHGARATKPAELGSALAIFLARLLDLLGYGLNLETCLHCGRPVEQMKNPRLTLGGGVVLPDSCPAGHRRPPGSAWAGQVPGRRPGPGAPAPYPACACPPDRLPLALGFLSRAFGGRWWDHDLPSLGLALRSLKALFPPTSPTFPRQ